MVWLVELPVMIVVPLNTPQESEMEVIDGLIVVILLSWTGTRFIH